MDVTTLTHDVTGRVLRPEDEGYAEEVAAFNVSRQHTPDVVVVPQSAEDVALTVRWAGTTICRSACRRPATVRCCRSPRAS